ncbi:hypothetical protein [Paenibacillus polymyxa]|uniref:hypothetical protein n=1 Tax=Paenibacillus polymyxa TaxID=1406 RepID=UPI0006C60FA0|nr:hypothetical protein [Paenibacillus polymyxa]KOS04162.1 hypothetical protein AM598_02505 [Paenibacillus polymyxa]
MGNPYPWKYNTSENTAAELDPRYETPLGAQERADKAEQDSKEYTDALDDRFKAHTADQTVHVTQTDHNKLDGIEWGAEVNQNAYTVINGIPANAPMTEFTIIQGIGIRVTKDPDGRSVTITATGPVDIDPIPLSKVYDAGNSAYLDAGTAAGNVPVLGVNGKLDAVVVPAIAVTDTFLVAAEAEMLALEAQTGDVAVRTDLSKSFILRVNDPTVLSNWQELLTPMSPVQSVSGKTGVVTLTKSDVGLGNVTNESKTTMFTNPDLTGVPTAPTAATATNTTQIATTAYVKAQGYITAGSTGWAAVTFANSWTSYTGRTVGYIKKTDGIVHIRGSITGGTVTNGTTIFTLPAGFRPTQNMSFVVAFSKGDGTYGTGAVVVAVNGTVYVDGITNNTLIPLDSIIFPTD